jgi:serine/threonine-protein kinase
MDRVEHPALASGTRVGVYVVDMLIGRGGMGEVYRARDTTLGRDVALKVLRPLLAADSDLTARLEREARLLASLNHPNVAQIHALEHSSSAPALVMELVDGETLADCMARGPLSIDEALGIGRQMAAALEAAHEHGIIHRDLKPSNVRIRPDGLVKVLDFGLAKLIEPGPDESLGSPTVSTRATGQGFILGTAAYMSPEQAVGRPVDRRADLWAFGVVLMETLTGRRVFAGESVPDVIAAVLSSEPDWTSLPDQTPTEVRRLLRRCLTKDPRQRLDSAKVARFALEEAQPSTPPRPSDVVVASPVGRSLRGWITAAVAGIVGAGVAGYALGTTRRPPAPARPLRRFDVVLPASQRLAGLDYSSVAMTPDGSQIAYVATRGGRPQLFVRSMDNTDPVQIPGTADATSPFFSPDGRWIAFFANGKLKKVPMGGGAAVTICDATSGFGGTWGPGDRIVFSPTTGSGLMQVAAGGGVASRATTLDAQNGEFSHRWPDLMPDGDTVLFTVGSLGSWDDAQIVAQSLATGRRTPLVQGGTYPRYLKSGYLAYVHAGVLLTVPLDGRSLRISGQPTSALDNILESSDGAAQVAVSDSGDAAYVPAAATSAQRRLLSVDRSGASVTLGAPPRAYSTPRFSPDGRRLLVTISGTNDDLWVYDNATGALQQLTFDADAASPVWAPDGEHVTFSWSKDGPPNLFSIALGGQREERLASSEFRQTVGSWAPGGRLLAFVQSRPATGRDIWLLKTDERVSAPLLATTFDEASPQFSPDARLIAFVSNETGRSEVYVSRTDDPLQAMKQVSRDGGTEPIWSRTTHELIYRTGNSLMAVSPPASGDWSMAKPRLLFERAFEKGTIDVANYDAAPDGQRFVMIEAVARDTSAQQLRVVLNWAQSAGPR